MRAAVLLALLWALPLVGQGTVVQSAADSALEARTSEVAALLRCPVCQGLSVEDSPTELAQDMRATVRERLAAGESPDEVKAYFVSRYGEWILLRPEPAGINLIVYLLPLVSLLLGLAIIVVAVRRWTKRSRTDGAGAELVYEDDPEPIAGAPRR